MTTQQYHSLLEKDISGELGVEALEPAEQEAFIAQIGETILDSALLRLVAGLTAEQGAALAYYLEDEPSSELLMKHLFEHYTEFEAILTEEIIAFKEETVALFGGLEADTGIPVAA